MQDAATREMLASVPAGRALDVGGGHGQNIAVLSAAGHEVTVLGSEPACAERIEGRAAFQLGSLSSLPLPDRSFDLVLSYRMVAHLADWRRHVAELCRVSRRTVLIEFPVNVGIHHFAPRLLEAKRTIEHNTRNYLPFEEREVVAAFARHGFKPVRRRAQHFWPMAIHRLHGSKTLAVCLEGVPRAAGLTRRYGSPVIVRFDREDG